MALKHEWTYSKSCSRCSQTTVIMLDSSAHKRDRKVVERRDSVAGVADRATGSDWWRMGSTVAQASKLCFRFRSIRSEESLRKRDLPLHSSQARASSKGSEEPQRGRNNHQKLANGDRQGSREVAGFRSEEKEAK